VAWAAAAATPALPNGSFDQIPFDEDTIRYHKSEADGPVARLHKRLDQGDLKLKYNPAYGYLPSLLEELKVPQSSQVLVFSKTSFQRERVSPKTPRAIFFNDSVYVAWIPGSPVLELSCVDPRLGAVFYTLEDRQRRQPRFVRNDRCLECHTSAKSLSVPGYLVRSFAIDENGVVDLNNGISVVNHRTPIAERWGGWYVCGTHGTQTHRGNLIGTAAFARHEKEPNFMGNLTELSRFFDTSKYPQPTSDIVALMVLEHQAYMQNLITRLRYDAEFTLKYQGQVSLPKAVTTPFLKYLLFVDETPLVSPTKGTSDFANWFESQGPKDNQGRSLRQFDLQTRVFRYPCSYMIYSEAFSSLPREAKLVLYRRLWKILQGEDDNPEFQKIPVASREAILQILIETKADLPRYWTL
jgi:hypothetical protein